MNVGGEQCDGADSDACQGLCQSDCTCPAPVCGNGVLEAGERCDGANAAACPGLCAADCTCPPPVCGNGVVEAGEQCDGATMGPNCPPLLGFAGCFPPGNPQECHCCLGEGADCMGPCCEGSCYLLGAAGYVCSSHCIPTGSPCSPTIPCCSGAACGGGLCP